jgi:hypothetical protein
MGAPAVAFGDVAPARVRVPKVRGHQIKKNDR